jgi:hypothetical protein
VLIVAAIGIGTSEVNFDGLLGNFDFEKNFEDLGDSRVVPLV